MTKNPVYTELEPAELIRPHGRPLPDLIASNGHAYYVSHKGVQLRVLLVHPPKEEPRGSIILCPGRTEFIEKYFETIEDFCHRGFTVLVMDPRGQGLSQRLLPDNLKSYVEDFQDYADDYGFIADYFATSLPKPHISVGHSMGGCIVLQAIITGTISPSAVICSAPMLGLYDVGDDIMGVIIKTIAALGLSKRNLPFQNQEGGIPVPFKGNKLTSSQRRFDIWASYFQTTPRLRLGPPTVGWISAALKAMRFVNRNADKLKIPGLIVAAGGDPIVDPASNVAFSQKAQIEFHVIPGALHELFLEKDHYRHGFFEKIDAFLSDQAL